MPKLKLDENSVRRAALPPGKRQEIYWDTKEKGFGLRVSQASKAWVYQRDLAGGITRRVTLGEYPSMPLREAREAAARKKVSMMDGVDPTAERRQRVLEQQRQEWEKYTVEQAMENHIAFMRSKHCAERSIDQLRDEMSRLLGDWLKRPLASITRKDCIERHRELSDKGRHGPVAANRALRDFRACWRSAQRLFEQLPPHPVFVVYNKQSRKRSPIAWEELPAWWAKNEAKDNPVRRDVNILILLTGLRRTDACTIRWEHINFDKGTMHRPKPKGGIDRAFTIPLCTHLLVMLAKRKLENARLFGHDNGWVFPTWKNGNKVGHTRDPRDTKYVKDEDGKQHKITAAPTSHRLRDTFITGANEAAVDKLSYKTLANHAIPYGDVTDGYIRPSIEHLRACAEKIAVFLLAKASADAQGEPVRKAGA